VPYACSLAFNAGVARWQGRYVMVFRNDYGPAGTRELTGTNIGLATSADGIAWKVDPRPVLTVDSPEVRAICASDDRVRRFYDPRITIIDGQPHLCFAVDTDHGIRGGIATTDDFRSYRVRHLTVPDNRNLVLFPAKVGGRYCRLERPFASYCRPRASFDIFFGASPDLAHWGDHRFVLGVEDVPFANDKIGPAAPPVLTERGWLTLFHGVDIDPARGQHGWEPRWTKRYTAGVMLLDRDQPWKVVGMSKRPLIAPEASYETAGGFRDHVIFPTGMVLEDSGEVKIYYGAGDAVMALATADVHDLIGLCVDPRI
jgi:beta-1,4-mannooligosaccharide/beta-1,4-mannosyl-N-acetylglucosamine phosphorylase